MLKTMTFIAKKTANPSFSIVRRAWPSPPASEERIDAAKLQPLQQNTLRAGRSVASRARRREGTGRPQ
jgi:hypothetical protein